MSQDASHETVKARSYQKMWMEPLLLKTKEWDPEAFSRSLSSRLGLHLLKEENLHPTENEQPAEENLETLLMTKGGEAPYLVSLIHMPVPMPVSPEELLGAADNNYRWPEAADVAQTHQSHLLVVVMAPEHDEAELEQRANRLELARLFAEVAQVCCEQPDVLGILINQVFIQAADYASGVQAQLDAELYPLEGFVWTGIVRPDEESMLLYSVGLHRLGLHEVEMQVPMESIEEAVDFFGNLTYWLTQDDIIKIQDGDTLGYNNEHRCVLHFQEGQALSQEVMRVTFEPQSKH